MKSVTNPNRKGMGPMMMVMCVSVGLIGLVGATGCDEYGLVNYANVASWGGLADPWYTSSLGLPAYSPLYDPTSTIQSVVDYRQDAMDWSNAGWSDYIMQ